MITIKDFMESVDYRITECNDYCWQCYGNNATAMDSWSGSNDEGYSASIIFDRKTQTVYEFTVCDYGNNRAYRWIHPDYRVEHDKSAKTVGCNPEQAWDDVKYIDLEVAEDILEKTRCIVAGEEYDTRITLPLNLSDSEFLKLAMEAHARDITFNQLVIEILTEHAEAELAKHPKV